MLEKPSNTFDVIVVGAGPAGMSAAIEASNRGLTTLVLDDQPEPGGQIYRGVKSDRLADKSILGVDYYAGATLVDEFLECDAQYKSGATVWEVSADLRVAFSRQGVSQFAHGRNLVVATGAVERPVPIPGWTLPGVMTLGSAQILLKTSGAVPAGNYIVAGEGPLLFLTAAQLIRAGAPPTAILETGDRRKALAFAANPLACFSGLGAIAKGLRWLGEIRRAGVQHYRNVRMLSAHGDGRLSHVSFEVGSVPHRLDADTLFLHQGVAPQMNLPASLGCSLGWDGEKKIWKPMTGQYGLSSRENVYVVGDGAQILGADAAQHSGRLAAIRIAKIHLSGDTINVEAQERRHLRALKTERRFRRVLDKAHMPADEYLVPPRDETIVCRCEEVTAGELRAATKSGCSGINQLKFFTRAGMGPCQARTCGLTCSMLMAAESGVQPDKVGYVNIRPPIKPVLLGELASLAEKQGA